MLSLQISAKQCVNKTDVNVLLNMVREMIMLTEFGFVQEEEGWGWIFVNNLKFGWKQFFNVDAWLRLSKESDILGLGSQQVEAQIVC